MLMNAHLLTTHVPKNAQIQSDRLYASVIWDIILKVNSSVQVGIQFILFVYK